MSGLRGLIWLGLRLPSQQLAEGLIGEHRNYNLNSNNGYNWFGRPRRIQYIYQSESSNNHFEYGFREPPKYSHYLTAALLFPQLKQNTNSMNPLSQIITPIPKLIPTSDFNIDPRLLPDERASENEQKDQNPTSSKISTHNFPMSLGMRRNSAFSIYDRLLGNELQDKIKSNSDSSFSSALSEVTRKRVWKREKKDKREMSRLQTKNLNRYFRSKINEMLREVKDRSENPQERTKAEEVLNILNHSNKIMFSELREIMKEKWLQKQLTKCSAGLLKFIHGGKMGMQSKLIMLKYFNKILKAIRNPENFTCWK